MIALPMVLAGGAGVISVIGQGFPKEFSEMLRGLNCKVDVHFKIQEILGINQVFDTLGTRNCSLA
jgi:4-hydroxy-tetrahydrodipicolinate synthase